MSASFFDEIPAGTPPPGVQPNFINPPSQRVTLIVIVAVFTSLMAIIVLIRFYVRVFLTKSIGWDDYTCGFAAVLSCIHAWLLINATSFGYGTHMWDIRASTLMVASNVRWLSSIAIAYPAVVGMIKVSILIFYYRIFNINKQLRRIIIGSIICIVPVYTSYMIVAIVMSLECITLADSAARPLCDRDIYPINMPFGVFTVVTDFWILFLPVRSVLNLQLDKQRKLGLVAVFGIAAVACMVSLTRVIYYGITWTSTDPLWTASLQAELSTVEMNVGIIVASSPSFPKFFLKIRGFATSVHQSLSNRTIPLNSVQGSKISSGRIDDNSKTKIIDDEVHRSNDSLSYTDQLGQSSTADQRDKTVYQMTQPIVRTDSYEVVYH